MRHLTSLSSIAVAVILLLAGSAFALEAEHSFTGGAITGLGTDGDILGNTIDGLVIGDTFEVAIALDNTAGDDISTVFTHLAYDNTVINIVNGFVSLVDFPGEGGFTGNNLIPLGPPEDAVGQPAGTAISIAFGVSNPATGNGVYSAPNSGVVAIAIFQVVGNGATDIDHIDTGNTIFNGFFQSPTFSAPLLIVVSDMDGDLIPDALDNCSEIPNGPNEGGLNQQDGDMDGYGNACDADFNNSGATDGGDFGVFIGAWNTFNSSVDLTGDGVVDGADFILFISSFSTLPGPSGLACAGITIPCP